MINMRVRDLLVVLALIICEFVVRCARFRNLVRPLEAEELIHLVHSQTFGVVDEEESIYTRCNQCGGEEHIYAPLHARVHLRKCFGDDQSPDPNRCRGEGTRN